MCMYKSNVHDNEDKRGRNKRAIKLGTRCESVCSEYEPASSSGQRSKPGHKRAPINP